MLSAPPLMQFSAARPNMAGFRQAASRPRPTVRCAAAVASSAPAGTGRCTLYEVLGLRAGATSGEIKAAYRRLARERHPDVAGAAGDEFIRLHDAYATLSDPDARARYDRHVVTQSYYAHPPAARPHGVSSRPRRTWETDQCW